jgi:hypothetical protein
LAVPIKAVTSVILTDLWVPIVTDTSVCSYTYVVPVLAGLPENVVAQYKEGLGYPTGVLGVIPLVPLASSPAFTYFTSFGSERGQAASWRIDFPFAVGQLSELHMQLWTWQGNTTTGWGGGLYAPQLYPFTAESLRSPPAKTDNYWAVVEIEHQQ